MKALALDKRFYLGPAHDRHLRAQRLPLEGEHLHQRHHLEAERDIFIDNLLVRIHFIIVMIRWTGLAP